LTPVEPCLRLIQISTQSQRFDPSEAAPREEIAIGQSLFLRGDELLQRKAGMAEAQGPVRHRERRECLAAWQRPPGPIDRQLLLPRRGPLSAGFAMDLAQDQVDLAVKEREQGGAWFDPEKSQDRQGEIRRAAYLHL